MNGSVWKVPVAHVPWYLVFQVHGRVRAERFKLTLPSVSDCNIDRLFFASEQVKIQCVVVLVLAGGW